METSGTPAEIGEHFVLKTNLVLIDQPFPQAGIRFRKENHPQIDVVARGQGVEDRNPVRGDDLSHQRQPSLHDRLSR
jgi:hypothetical protein